MSAPETPRERAERLWEAAGYARAAYHAAVDAATAAAAADAAATAAAAAVTDAATAAAFDSGRARYEKEHP